MECRREDFAKGQEDIGVIEPASDNLLISLHDGSFSCYVNKSTCRGGQEKKAGL